MHISWERFSNSSMISDTSFSIRRTDAGELNKPESYARPRLPLPIAHLRIGAYEIESALSPFA
jgi:hypothetical protein